jgi:hypothetical protein
MPSPPRSRSSPALIARSSAWFPSGDDRLAG